MLLNGASLNSTSLNGGSFYSPVLGEAQLTGSVILSITAKKNNPGRGDFYGSGNVLVTPKLTMYTGGVINGYAQILPYSQLSLSARSNVDTKANIVAYVYRNIWAHVDLAGTASLQALPQGVLGKANINTSVSITAEVTRHRATKANQIISTAEVVADSLITREIASDTSNRGTATLRVEASISLGGTGDFIHDAYVGIPCSANVSINDVGRVIRRVGAAITGQANIDVTPYKIYPSKTLNLEGIGRTEITSNPWVITQGQASIYTLGQVNATALRTVLPESAIQGSASIFTKMVQKHIVAASLTGLCQGDVTPLLINNAHVDLIGYSELNSYAERQRPGYANIFNESSVEATARSNIEAYDPEERTMYRKYVNRTMSVSFTDYEMRRIA